MLGRTNGRCRVCYLATNARVDAQRMNTVNRQLTLARARLRYRMNRKITRLSELERMLNAS